jgi:hypothetical protein
VLLKKINADFVSQFKASINIELTNLPVVMMYERALAAFLHEANRKFPSQTLVMTKAKRFINKISRAPSNNRFAGRGHGRRGGSSRG